MNLTLRYAARSDRGLIRDGNQDSVYAGPRLLAVADGMGGMAAGDVASNIVIAAMAPLDEDVPGDAMLDTLRGCVATANQQLRDTVEANPELEGMGTTLTALLFSGSRAGMVHIGDSRAYLLRDDEFTQITKDDTYVQMLVDEGRISLEEASEHPQRSLLTRAMDGRDVDPEFSVRHVLPGDRYLICSDGLSGVVSADTIAETLRQYAEPHECVERLLALALRGGGPDNISVIVADATDEDIIEQAPIVDGAAARAGSLPGATESTPAARASALNPPRPATPEPEEPADDVEEQAPPRRPVRNATLLLLLLALLGGGLWYGWTVSQSTYYLGVADDGQVAVFQGLPGSVAGVELSRVHTTSGTDVDDLTTVAQQRVRQGDIRADTAEEAERRMSELIRSHLKPLCPPEPTPTPTPSPSPSPSPSPDATASPDASPHADAAAGQDESPTPTEEPIVGSPPVFDRADCRTR
jgi:PPM family protein phosphatase